MWQSRLFSVGPQFHRRGRRLLIRSSAVTRALSLGLLNRTVTVDPERKVLTVRDKRLWFRSRTERYPFDLVTAVSFSFLRGIAHDSTAFGSDRVEAYAVGLKLYGTAEPDVHLFWFVGEGRFTNNGPLPDWVYWYESLTDVCGTHEEEAQQFVTCLAWAMNKPIVPK